MMVQPEMKHTLTKLETRMYINGQTNILSEERLIMNIKAPYNRSAMNNTQVQMMNVKQYPQRAAQILCQFLLVNETWC
jgi:hypothetical protein